MKTLLKLAFTAAVTVSLVKAFLRQIEARSGTRAGDADESRSDDAVPTLHAVQDAEPTREEPLREGDLNVAQNAPF